MDALKVVHSKLQEVKKKDLDISLKDDVLTMKTSTQHVKQKDEDEYYCREINWGKYQRLFRLQGIVDSDKVKRKFRDGILELEIAKEKLTKRRTIKVE